MCPASDFSYTLRTTNPAQWANYMSCSGDFPCTYVLQTLSSGHIICPAPVISPALHVLQNPAHLENSMSGQWFILRFKYRKTCPVGKFYVLPSDVPYTLRTRNAARWADSTS
jgi:hypothetical protein